MIPVMDEHPREKAVVSLRDRWLLCRQRDGREVADLAERMSFAEKWRLGAESSEFHLTLNRAHLERIFSNSKYAKKRVILKMLIQFGSAAHHNYG